MANYVEFIKVASNLNSLKAAAKEIGFESFNTIKENIEQAHQMLEEAHKKEQEERANVESVADKLLGTFSEDQHKLLLSVLAEKAGIKIGDSSVLTPKATKKVVASSNTELRITKLDTKESIGYAIRGAVSKKPENKHKLDFIHECMAAFDVKDKRGLIALLDENSKMVDHHGYRVEICEKQEKQELGKS